ncbi:uncharacterized protein LOC106645092 [Copidosoma floridanum]|uniref:uncharacterized protein LOC106645092 n=1 Tax=Copidosoma floridanum TaxID=29053 RepID=UPI000C6FBF4C|nr:uncharacterized protein LOC106645092 [Copidosoma floridanum]
MPGVVDSHVHLDEPGRGDWEGFWTGSRAAAAGGVTTIVDMPLDSIPPTTTVENLRSKARAARTQLFVDIGFWGGVIPGNREDLKPLSEAGVVGFKCFLCPSGVDEFPQVTETDIRNAMLELRRLNSVLAFHAELDVDDVSNKTNGDPYDYETFLATRPATMEVNALKMIAKLCSEYKYPCHVVHLSAAEGLDLIKIAKDEQRLPITVETCNHYLHLTAEEIPRSATQFKCNPPIRDKTNREKLWSGLKDGTLDLVGSDHSPCPEDLKLNHDFLQAWGGISSLQFSLPLFWTEARNRGFGLPDVARLMCSAPAQLCGLGGTKGRLEPGLDADFVVWDPERTIEIQPSGIFHKHKLTPYLGEKLFGKVFATIVRGNFVYKNGEFSEKPLGKLLLQENFLSNL